MTFKRIAVTLFATAGALPGCCASAQQPPAITFSEKVPPNRPDPFTPAVTGTWAQGGSDIPLDPAWRTGTLDNGLRYAVRRSAAPPGTVSIRIRVAAGALMEEDSQQGWAHFMEHLVFRGTDADGTDGQQALERLGVNVGSDQNASTTLTATTFMLDVPNADAAKYGAALALLARLVQNPRIDAETIAVERQVVIAEKAQRLPPPADAVQAAQRSLFFRGLKARERDIGGTPETLGAATVEQLKSFHRRWYRPSRVQVIVAGDADPAMLEAAVRRTFADWRDEGPAPPEPVYGQLAADGPHAATVIHPQAPALLLIDFARPHDEGPFTRARQEQQYVNRIATAVIANRLGVEALKGKDLVGATLGTAESRHVSDELRVQVTPRQGQWRGALTETFAVLNGLETAPPTQAEIDEQAVNLRGNLLRLEVTDASRTSAQLANEFVHDVDQGDVTASRHYYVALFDVMRAGLTPDVVWNSIRRQLQPQPKLLVMASQPIEGGEIAPELALAQAERASPLQPQALQAVSLDQLHLPGIPGKVVSSRTIDDLGIDQVRFANGLTLVMKHTGFENRIIRLQLQVGYGVLNRSPDDPGFYWPGLPLSGLGVGPFGPEELSRLSAGHSIGSAVQPSAEVLRIVSLTNQHDLPDALKLMAGALSQPRFEPAQLDRIKGQFAAAYPALFTSPTKVLQLSGAPLLNGGDTRFTVLPTPDALNKIRPDQFQAFWTEVLGSGPRKLIVVGDFDRVALIDAVSHTLGALPEAIERAPTPAQLSVANSPPAGTSLVLEHHGDPGQMVLAHVYPMFGGLKDIAKDRALAVTAKLIQTALNEQFRAAEGGTYTPFVDTAQSMRLKDHGYLLVGAQLQPAKADELRAVLDHIVTDLAQQGPAPDALSRAKATIESELTRLQSNNVYWVNVLAMNLDNPQAVRAIRTATTSIDAVDAAAVRALARDYLVGRGFEVQVVAKPAARP